MEHFDRTKIRNKEFQSQPSYEVVKFIREERNVELRKKNRRKFTNNKRKLNSQDDCFFKVDDSWLDEDLLKINKELASESLSVNEKLEILMDLSVSLPLSVSLIASNAAYLLLEINKSTLNNINFK